ncbi:MAG: nucleotide exchange factor GrpE [Clostridia bacterium]
MNNLEIQPIENLEIESCTKEKAKIADKARSWHNEIENLQQSLNVLQPTLGEMLKTIMNFSNDLTEKYILKFAKLQIELFNLICDNLAYHSKAVQESEHQDYINSVSNYNEFLEMITDNLSVFGVEEITSPIGTEFNGSIHEVINDIDFSPRSTTVISTVHCGFQYKDIVIQKEKIKV